MTVTVFRGGSLFDGERHVGAGTLVVVDGRIAAVVLDDLDPPSGARVVDLGGGLLAPGFVDAHVHAVQGGLERIRCDLTGARTREECLGLVASYVRDHPAEPWVLGGGWSMSSFPGGTPTADDLDAVAEGRPVFLVNRDHHGAWVSSRALSLAGLDATTPDPPHGRIERDSTGAPSGTLHEAAMALVSRLVPETSSSEHRQALLAGQAHLHACGVTGWQDAIVGDYAGMADAGPTYAEAARTGELTAHVVGALWWDRDRGVEQVDSLVERRAAYSSGRFVATSVKIMQDGVAENGSAALGSPYLDRCGHPTDNRGHSFVDPQALRHHVARLDAEGFQVHVHAIGDRGVTEALDAFEGLDPSRDLRHHVAHLQLVRPDDVTRFGALGIAANMQALWACLDEQMTELTLPFLGPERAAWQYPFGDLVRGGARLVAGSDWPVSTPDPLAAIHTAVTRTSYDDPGRAGSEPLNPEQRLDLATAFGAYTSGSAWVNHRDDAGRLRPGAVADLVVLDRDPFVRPVEEIGAARVVSTWVEGREVHQG